MKFDGTDVILLVILRYPGLYPTDDSTPLFREIKKLYLYKISLKGILFSPWSSKMHHHNQNKILA